MKEINDPNQALASQRPKAENQEQEKYRPPIEFSCDSDTDKQICWGFFRLGRGVFLDGLNLEYPIKDEEATKAKISQAIDDFYKDNQEGIAERVKQAEINWIKVEDSFYKKVDKLFSGYAWPKPDGEIKEYQAIGSILGIFPRDIYRKTFAFPANPLKNKFNPNLVIAHEMLHFITYDYLEKIYNLDPSEHNSQDNKFWQFTENLNALIEAEPMWAEFLGQGKPNRKPECAELYDEMEKIWREDKDLDNLIKQVFDIK